MRKRIISAIIAFAIAFSIPMSVINSFSAAQPDSLLITDCDTLDGWTKGSGNALSINANGFGSGSSAVACDINNGAFRTAVYTASEPVDISPYQNIEWDVMMHTGAQPGMWDDIQQYYGDEVYLKIGSSESDYNIYRLSKMTVEQDTGNNLWYHFSVDIDDPSSTTGSFDMTRMTVFSFTTVDGAVNASVRNGHIRLDNIYAANLREEEPPQESAVISECETKEGWSYGGAEGNWRADTGMTGNSIYVYTGYAALRKLTYTASMDLTGYNTIEFDLRCKEVGSTDSAGLLSVIAESYGGDMAVEVSDSTGTYTYGYSEWQVEPLENNWYHITVQTDRGTSQKPDMSAFTSFSIYFKTEGALDEELPNTDINIDNLAASFTEVKDPGDETGIWEIPGSFSKENSTGTFTFETKGFEFDLSDYEKNALWLCMDIYVANTDGTDSIDEFTSDGQIELTSSGTCDVEEASWQFPRIGLKSGSNKIRLLISGAAADNGLDLSSVNYLRIYSRNGGEDTFDIRIENIYITRNEEESVTGTYFSDGMMFKQNAPMKVFGYTKEAGSSVEARLYREEELLETEACVSGENGYWTVSFDGREGGYQEYRIEISVDGTLEKTINDILIGELWLAAGQSNMEFFVLQTIPDYDYSLIPINENVRFFDEPLVPGGAESILPSTPAKDIPEAKWSDGSSAANVRYISAIAYYMSLALQEELNVPVGFINAAKGASGIESWLSRETIESDSEIMGTLVERGAYKTAEELESITSNWTYMTTLYNTKIAPLAGISISGIIWYQGENNIKYADEDGTNDFYTAALTGLIESYSDLFGFERGEMPFVFAHLAPYNYQSVRPGDYTTILAGFSESLSKAAENAEAKVSQLPIYDISLEYKDPPANNPDPIHPSSKSEVASRFATAVLGAYYGIGNSDASTAPAVSGVSISGNKITVTFKNVGDGLKTLSSDTVHGFAAAGSDRVFVGADAKIVSYNTVEVSAEGISNPVAVTYAWDSFNMASNLCNSSGIPAVPYRSDEVSSTYYLSKNWTYFDSEKVWDAQTTLDAGYKNALSISDGDSAVFDQTVKQEGSASLKLSYDAGGATVSPVLTYGGMISQFDSYSGMTVYVSNPDSAPKDIELRITAPSGSYYASIITGSVLSSKYTVPANSGFTAYTFNFDRIINDEGKVVIDTGDILKTLSGIEIIVSDSGAGSLYIDAASFRTDVLPTPGSENDDIVKPDPIIIPGTVNEDGSMWMSDADTADNWSSNPALAVDTENKTQGNASVGTTAIGSILRQIVFTVDSPIDISDYDYLEFDIYFSDLSWYNASTGVMFELTSSGTSDVESNRYMKGAIQTACPELYSDALTGAGGGKWYHVRLDINNPQGQANGGLDTAEFNYFRFYTIGAPSGTPDYTMRLDNLLFTKKSSGGGGSSEPEVNYDSYGEIAEGGDMWLSTAESVNWWSANGATVSLNSVLKTQGNTSVGATAANGVLREIAFTPSHSIDISDYAYLEFDVWFSNLDWVNASENMMIELTSSGRCDVESYRFTKSSLIESCVEFANDVESGTGGNKWYHFRINLNAPHDKPNGGLNFEEFNYFRFYSIGAPAGTRSYEVYFDNMRFVKGEVADKIIITDDALILNNCDSTAGWTANGAEVVLDKELKVSGIGSIGVTAKNGILRQLAYTPDEPVDISKYNYVEFYLYLSDVSALRTSTGFMVELTSSGTYDEQSNRYLKSAIFAGCPELAEAVASGEPSPGWYHIRLNLKNPQNQARGGLDLTAFNFFRIYFIGAAEGTPDTIVRIDDLRFTVGSPQDNTSGSNTGTSTGGSSSSGEDYDTPELLENPGLHVNLITENLSVGLIIAVSGLGVFIVLIVALAAVLLKKHKI